MAERAAESSCRCAKLFSTLKATFGCWQQPAVAERMHFPVLTDTS